jgi:predicted nucleic acid-binding protein
LSYLYLDTSAVVKKYTIETGSKWIQNLLDPNNGNKVVVSEITLAEFAAAISSKYRAGAISLSDRTKIIDLFLKHCIQSTSLLMLIVML